MEKFSVLVQALEEWFTLEIPGANFKVISFECIDTRLLKAYRKISRMLGFKAGDLYPNKTKGAVNDLLSQNIAIKLECFNTIELLAKNGADTVILSAHTDCAADKKIHGERPYEVDLAYQMEKLQKAYLKVKDYSDSKRLGLKIKCFLLDIQEKKVTVSEVTHFMSDKDSSEQQKSASTNS